MTKNTKLNYIFYISLIILSICLFFQVSIGSFSMSFSQIINGIFNYDLLFNSTYLLRHFFGDTLCNFFNLPTKCFKFSSICNVKTRLEHCFIPIYIIVVTYSTKTDKKEAGQTTSSSLLKYVWEPVTSRSPYT